MHPRLNAQDLHGKAEYHHRLHDIFVTEMKVTRSLKPKSAARLTVPNLGKKIMCKSVGIQVTRLSSCLGNAFHAVRFSVP